MSSYREVWVVLGRALYGPSNIATKGTMALASQFESFKIENRIDTFF